MQSFKLAHITQNLELIALYKVIYKYKKKICSFWQPNCEIHRLQKTPAKSCFLYNPKSLRVHFIVKYKDNA